MVTPSASAAAKSFSAARAVVPLSRDASPLTASCTRGCTKSAGTNCKGVSGRRLLTMTHWLAGSLRENCWDSTPDGGAFDGGALDGGSLAGAAGTGVVVVGVGFAVCGPEEDGADVGEATRVSGLQAAKAAIPTPAPSSVAKDLRLGPQV